MDAARTHLRDAMKRAGGVMAVAARIEVPYTSLYRFLAGKDLEARARRKLRAALPDVPAEVWADAFVPPPESTPAPAVEATP